MCEPFVAMVAAVVTNVEGLCCDEHRVKEVIRQ